MAIARFPSIVLDCSDPRPVAEFYGALLGWNVEASAEWADVKSPDGQQCLSFQPVADYQAPEWPSQDRPQQMHLDVMVEDLDRAEAAVLELGASKHDHQPGTTFRVFLDPAGHPFCTCVS
jgi:predicted enzyme related to lactoylglutathione lyase